MSSIPPTTHWRLKDADVEQFRHADCKPLIDMCENKTICDECFKLRRNLQQNYRRQQTSTTDRIAPSSRVPLKHLSNNELLQRYKGIRSALVTCYRELNQFVEKQKEKMITIAKDDEFQQSLKDVFQNCVDNLSIEQQAKLPNAFKALLFEQLQAFEEERHVWHSMHV
jgi:hypothetical protein